MSVLRRRTWVERPVRLKSSWIKSSSTSTKNLREPARPGRRRRRAGGGSHVWREWALRRRHGDSRARRSICGHARARAAGARRRAAARSSRRWTRAARAPPPTAAPWAGRLALARAEAWAAGGERGALVALERAEPAHPRGVVVLRLRQLRLLLLRRACATRRPRESSGGRARGHSVAAARQAQRENPRALDGGSARGRSGGVAGRAGRARRAGGVSLHGG